MRSEMHHSFYNDIHQDAGLSMENNMSENDVSTKTAFGELNDAPLARSFVHKQRLWLDGHGIARITYAVGTTSDLNTEAALRAVLITVLHTASLWTDQTDGCVQFARLSADSCSKPENLHHGVIYINTFKAKCCSTYSGMLYGQEAGAKKCQEMCIDRRGCTHIEIRKLMSSTLGLLSPINRPDRDEYIAFHPELLSNRLWPPLSFSAKPRWLSLQKCSSTAVNMDVPVPYDYLSTLHPVTSQYSDSMGDPQGVIVTQDGSKQYLLDHRHAACPELSHLDLYQVRKAYGCDKKFAQDCQNTPPKCLNYGYLKKDCTCACTKHFSGSRCEKRIDDGPIFCSGNAWFLNVTASGFYDTATLNMHLNENGDLTPSNGNYPIKFMQFLTVSVQLTGLGKHVSVAVSHTTLQTVISRLQSKLIFFIENINMTECDLHSGGFVLYWGASLSKHIRTWCFSSLFLNEPSPTILRSRVPKTLDLTFRSSLGILVGDAQLSVDALQLQLEVSYFGVMNRTRHDSEEENGGGERPFGGGGNKSTAGALMGVGAGAGGLIGAVLMGVLLLVVIGGLAAWTWSRADNGEDPEYSDLSSEDPEADETATVRTQESEEASEDFGQTGEGVDPAQEASDAREDGDAP